MYYVVTKRVKDLPKRGKQWYGVDPEYPLEGFEVDTLQEADDRFPGLPVMTVEEYNKIHKPEMNERFDKTWKKRPFWKFWG